MKTYNILEYGANPQTPNNAVAIQNAIDSCAAAGGGTVWVPPGVYVSGPLELRSHVTLQLEAGATLQASQRLEDYPLENDRRTGESGRAGFITAREAVNIAITGRGTVDGSGFTFVSHSELHHGQDTDIRYTRQGQDFMHPRFGTQHGPLAHGERPGNLLRFFNCKNVLLSGVTIQNSPTWTVNIYACESVAVLGVHINSQASDRRVPNDDGIDVCRSQRVRIADCDIDTGDDCIAVFGSQMLAVSNCTLSSHSSGIRVGYHAGESRDCTFNNLVIRSNRGICIHVRGEGSVENILFSNLVLQTRLVTGHWWGKGEPVQISAMPQDPHAHQLGRIRNVRFTNVSAEAESGIVLYGCPESILEEIVFTNFRLRITNSPLHLSYGGNFDLRGVADLSQALFQHDIPAVYGRYFKGLTLQDFKVGWEEGLPDFFNHALQCEHYQDLVLRNFEGQAPHPGGQVLALSEQ